LVDADRTPEAPVVEEREPQPALSIRQTVELARLSEAQGESLRELWSSIDRRGVKPAGSPFVRYHTFGETETDLEVGIPVVDASSGEGQVTAGELPGGTALTTWHIGSHDGLGDAYARLDAWLKEHDRKPDGAAWEVYTWIDPGLEPDPSAWPAPSEWRTQLIQPIR
jgi:effector-binding domain-containing protein